MLDYINAVNDRVEKEQSELFDRLKKQARAEKDRVLSLYQQYFPQLWDVCSEKFLNAPPVFLNNGMSHVGLSGFGAPGVLVDGLVFSVYRNSYCLSFCVGVYNGLEPVTASGSVMSEGLRHDEKMAALLKTLLAKTDRT